MITLNYAGTHLQRDILAIFVGMEVYCVEGIIEILIGKIGLGNQLNRKVYLVD